MKTKLTQDEIVQLLKDGWELGWYVGWGGRNGHFALQRNGLGKGGEVVYPHGSMVRALIKKGVIERRPRQKDDSYSTLRYGLTEDSK